MSDYPSADIHNTEPLNQKQTELFIFCTMAEAQNGTEAFTHKEGAELPFLSAIVQKRIDVMELPIKFTSAALVAINALANNPGRAVVLLIDALNKYKDQIVTMEKLADLYPHGFYKEEVFANIVDNFMKTRKHPFSEVYGATT